jgi:adenine-specific DNA-methyltransferase
MACPRKTNPALRDAKSYQHPDSDLSARPQIGAQAHFKNADPPTIYHFDSSLAPALEWNGQNAARERAEALIKEISEAGLKITERAWENLKKSLRVEFEDAIWDHVAGANSTPFPAGEHKQVAVKVIDPRGNEWLVVKKLEETV